MADRLAAPRLVTPRLVLRQIEPEDAASLFPVLSDPIVMRWWSSGPHGSMDETEAYVGRNAEIGEAHHNWAITEDGHTAHGWVMMTDKRPGVAEIGYILRGDRWGRGYTKEAVSAVISYAFAHLQMRRIYADTDPENVASIALLKSLGFTLEGHLRAEWRTHIGVRDSLIFGLLADEWPD